MGLESKPDISKTTLLLSHVRGKFRCWCKIENHLKIEIFRTADICRAGLHNIRPEGHMRLARSFLAARENSVAENVAKARLRIITCPFRISSTLWRNRFLRPAASLCWSIWPFELSELCRPAVGHVRKSTSLTTKRWMRPLYAMEKSRLTDLFRTCFLSSGGFFSDRASVWNPLRLSGILAIMVSI